jgi:hypothetical protein
MNVLYLCTICRCDICTLLDNCEYAKYNVKEKDTYYTEEIQSELSPGEKNICGHTETMFYDDIHQIKSMLQQKCYSDMAVVFPVSSNKVDVFKLFCRDILHIPRADNMTKNELEVVVNNWEKKNKINWVTCMTASSTVIKENFRVMQINPTRYENLLNMAKAKDPTSFPPTLNVLDKERHVMKFCCYLGISYENYII